MRTHAVGAEQLRVGRVRRIQLPIPLRVGPPTTRVDGEPVAVTIDYDSFGADAPVTVPPT